MPINYVNAIVKEIERPTKDLCIVHLKLERPMPFIAGQFIGVSFMADERIVKKSYSISSSPADPYNIELCVKRVNGGRVSNFLYKLQEGDRITVEGPYGIFTLAYPPKRDLVFIATGTGIGPLRSMIKSLFERGTDRNVTLVYGVRHEEDLMYRQDFESLQTHHKNFKFVPVLSKPHKGWEGEKGYAQHAAEKILEPKKHDVYVCGVLPMVEDTKALLKSMGFEKENVRLERYV